MQFQHSADIWRDFPQLVPGVVYAEGITAGAVTGPAADRFAAVAKSRLAAVAVFDVAQVTGPLEVRYATGDETYLTFAGEVEHPAPGEVIFADQAGQAHARRWTNRQSGLSAVRNSTAAALIVAEALHDPAPGGGAELTAALTGEIRAAWSIAPRKAVLTASAPRFTQETQPPGGSGERRDRQ
jgi:DNA/RNA-binding domain of Phe-tRNA-synthetase-like protein